MNKRIPALLILCQNRDYTWESLRADIDVARRMFGDKPIVVAALEDGVLIATASGADGLRFEVKETVAGHQEGQWDAFGLSMNDAIDKQIGWQSFRSLDAFLNNDIIEQSWFDGEDIKKALGK